MGRTQFKHLNQIAREIWQWCEVRNIIIIASYISSKNNVEADKESRKSKTKIEYELADWAFLKILKIFGAPQIDLFASRLNHKCNRYFSWRKDSDSEAIEPSLLKKII
uniref:RNase H type-1 domain-containing protein n=1 Tax=Trichogramma kaykai TaxID=54128 RepID=A0ABD2WJ26_9HYME